MGSGLASFAAGFGGGYLNAKRQGMLDEERQADRAMRQQEFDARMGEVNDAKNLKLSLANAVRPGTANENGATLAMADGTKTVYDDGDVAGSDFRQLRRADEATGNQTLASTQQSIDGARPAPIGLSSALNKGAPAALAEGGTATPSMGLADVRMPMAPQKTATMNGKAFGSLADAQTAATAHNAPTARAERQAAAYDAAGQPEKAAQMREMAQAVADKAFQRKLGAAMRFPGDTRHDGIAKLVTESEYGPMAGKTLKAVPSADGKMVTYNTVNPDGTLTPSGMSFSNDDAGIIKAAWMLDGAITPEHRYTTHVAERKAAAQQVKDAAVFDETKRHNLAVEGAAGAKNVPSGYRATAAGGLEPIPGGPAAVKAGAASAGKPLPISAAKGILENQTNLRRAQTALALVNGETVDGATGDPAATGWKGLLPNQVLNRVDSTGVNTRAAIADLGSLVIHDRSGAAVTAAEFPRLAPFIPGATDDAATVKKKLELFTKNYQAIVDDASEFYRSSGYNVPTEVLRDGKGGQAAPAGKPATAAGSIPKGTAKPAASGTKDGATSVSKSGKPIVMRGGNWEYQ